MNPDNIPFMDLKNIATNYGISEFYAFGSRAREIAARVVGKEVRVIHPESDLDIAVEAVPGRRLSAREKVEITVSLEDLFQVPRVDLIVMSEVSPFLALEAIQGELLYCCDFDQQAEHELLILRKVADLAYYERMRRNAILKA